MLILLIVMIILQVMPTILLLDTATPKATKNGNLDDKKDLDFAEMFYNGRIFIGANFRAV